MSKASKTTKNPSLNDPDAVGPGFGERHKDLIWVVIIIFVLAGPLVFAALTVLSLFK